MNRVTGFLGFGTNLGDRKKNLDQALTIINNRPDLAVFRTSSIYETEPWGLTNQPKFLNMVAEIRTSISPGKLLERVKKLEQDMGRGAGPRFGPRLIDIDILLLEDQVVDEHNLKIPHICLHERAFVLVPLAELAPELVHPKLGVTVSNLAKNVGFKEPRVLTSRPIKINNPKS